MRLPAFLTRNLRLKVGCTLLAFVTWVGVVYAGNPPETRVIAVPVPQARTSVPAAFILIHPVSDLSVRIGGNQNTLDAFNPSTLGVSVDWAAVTHAGVQLVPVSIINTDPSIELIDAPQTVLVDVDSLTSVAVPVTIVISNPPPVGYLPGQEAAAPSTVAISGPRHELTGLQARVTIDLGSQKANFEALLPVFVYDARGNRLSDVGVSPNQVTVTITLQASLTSRAVAVLPRVAGKVASGFNLVGITYVPQIVVLSGPQDLLNSLDAVPTAVISLNGIFGDLTLTVALNPPAGVTATPNTVTVTIVVAAAPSPSPSPTPSPTPSVTP